MRKHHLLAVALGFVTAVALFSSAGAQQHFTTPEEGANALVAAVRAGDGKAVRTVLGPDSADIVSSGDSVADEEIRTLFLAAYDAKHSIEKKGDNWASMVLGQVEWPFPIPLVKKGDTWEFDTATGRQEILARRIGRDELATIQACLAYVDAQNEYAETSSPTSYAQRIVSSPGKKDGLYWPTATGETPSPLGELVADATERGYRVGGQPSPYNGYFFKILTKQGPTARGGAQDYVVKGHMIGGFALVAYPAQYGNSGVMTFVVNHDGDVYEKDLGPSTARIASRMTAYAPDQTWKKVTVDTAKP